MFTWTRRLFAALCWMGVLAAIAGIAGHFYPGISRPTVLLAAAAPVLMLAAAVAAVGFALMRKMVGAAVAVTLALAGAAIQAPLFLGEDVTNTGRTLMVMQVNIELGSGAPAAVAALVRDHDVDVLSVSELTQEAADGISAELAVTLPYSFAAPGPQAGGGGIWSRYPLTDTRELDGLAMAGLAANVMVPDSAAVQLFSLHPPPPYPWDPHWWSGDMQRIKQILEQAPMDRPVVVGADFNSTYDFPLYRKLLTDGYRDAAEQAGSGIQLTYPADRMYPPLVAIDHVLVRGPQARSTSVYPVGAADHRAMIAELVLPALNP